MKTNSVGDGDDGGASCGCPNYPVIVLSFGGTNNSPKRGGSIEEIFGGSKMEISTPPPPPSPPTTIIQSSFGHPGVERKRGERGGGIWKTRRIAVSPSGISGPIKRISIHPFPPPPLPRPECIKLVLIILSTTGRQTAIITARARKRAGTFGESVVQNVTSDKITSKIDYRARAQDVDLEMERN